MVSALRKLSTISLDTLLTEVIDNPAVWASNTDFINVLKSQSKLASWEDIERKIAKCTLNTLKASADKVLNDGFPGLDRRRIGALKLLEKEAAKEFRPKRGTRAHFELKVKEQSEQIAALEARNMTLTYYIRELQVLASNAMYYSKSEAVKIRHQRELDLIHIKLSSCSEASLIVL